MAIINLAALGALLWVLSFRYREKITDCLPAAASLLVLTLYVLALLGRLSWIDWLSLAGLTAFVIYLVCCGRQRRKEWLDWGKKALRQPGLWVALLAAVGTAALTSGKAVTWWDDYNFWAVDAKSLFFLDGFAGRYANVAPEFGDYPPALQLFKWFFLHLSPGQFQEGLLFSGYYTFLLLYLAPLFRRFRWKNPLAVLAAAVTLVLFPSVAEAFYCSGACADLGMAVVYGAFLTAAADREGHDSRFYALRLGLYAGVLVLVKSVGFLWALFALAFWGLYRLAQRKERKESKADGRRKERKESAADGGRRIRPGTIFVLAVPAACGLSWLFFCLERHRVAKLTGAAIRMAAGGVKLPAQTGELLESFFTAFVFWPLHRYRTPLLDLSPLALFLLIGVLLAVLRKLGAVSKRWFRYLFPFVLGSGLLFYGINLFSHLTIFATETQYLEPFSMVSSIERYGAPFTIGSLYLIAWLFLEWKGWRRDWLPWLCLAGFVWLSAAHGQVYRGFIAYGEDKQLALQERAAMVGDEGRAFLTRTEELWKAESGRDFRGARVLYLRDGGQGHWVKDTYISFEASPVSVMYANVNYGETTEDQVERAVRDAHAAYLYLDAFGAEEEIQALFAPFLKEGERFQPQALYEIQEGGEGLCLTIRTFP